LNRRGRYDLLEQLVIGAYSIPGNRPIQWGAGGPERWPNTRPYFTPPGVEDQCGFRIFDWYTAISNAATSNKLPIFLFGMGYSSKFKNFISQNLTIARLLKGEFIEGYDPIPDEIVGGAFSPLADPKTEIGSGWFQVDGTLNPQAEALKQRFESKSKVPQNPSTISTDIRHYLLLPSYEWGVSDYHLDIIRPFIKKHQPTIGFSLEEAQHAQRVTVLGGEEAYSEESLNQLRAAGAIVKRIDENGMNIATRLTTF
jgi:hypothetical protein